MRPLLGLSPRKRSAEVVPRSLRAPRGAAPRGPRLPHCRFCHAGLCGRLPRVTLPGDSQPRTLLGPGPGGNSGEGVAEPRAPAAELGRFPREVAVQIQATTCLLSNLVPRLLPPRNEAPNALPRKGTVDGKDADLYPALRKCQGPTPFPPASVVGRWERSVALTFCPAPRVLLSPVVCPGPLPVRPSPPLPAPGTGMEPKGGAPDV